MFWLQRRKKLATASIVLFIPLIFVIYESTNDGIFETDVVDIFTNKSYRKSPLSDLNNRSKICNNPASSNTNEITIHDDANLLNCPFSQNKLWYHKRLMKTEDLPLQEYTTDTKKILVWTYNWLDMPNPFTSNRSNWFRNFGCPIWQCEVVPWDNSSHANLNKSGIPVEDFDAVIFYDPLWTNRRDVPAKRSPKQHYVFWTVEPPGLTNNLRKWDESSNLFNWTMSYRWDSDILNPYGFTRQLTDAEIRSHKKLGKINYAEGKTQMAAWFVGNCVAQNGRFDYIKRLQHYIHIDIYGDCGSLQCRREKQKKCRTMMGRDYKFVIAFENSLCWDYVTEKFFYNINFNIVPIVLDLHGNYERFAPPKSYINALDFPSVKELADYLKIVDKNDTLYNEYFWWKGYYAFEYSLHLYELNIFEPAARGFCSLCSKLHQPSPRPTSVHNNLTKWWYNDATCKVLTFPDSNEPDKWAAVNYNPPLQ